MTDTAVPVLWCGDLTPTLDFYKALGYQVTEEQHRPYISGGVERNGCALHFTRSPQSGGDSEPAGAGCLVLVDDVATLHAEFTAGLRERYGKIPAKGVSRITRFRPGQSRFTVIDPNGNWIIYIRRGEPDEVEYGGSKDLKELARVLDNARILREFKNDDAAAIRVLEVGLRRYGASAPPVERARALAALTESAAATGDTARAQQWRAELAAMDLSADDRAAVAAELPADGDLAAWLSESS